MKRGHKYIRERLKHLHKIQIDLQSMAYEVLDIIEDIEDKLKEMEK